MQKTSPTNRILIKHEERVVFTMAGQNRTAFTRHEEMQHLAQENNRADPAN